MNYFFFINNTASIETIAAMVSAVSTVILAFCTFYYAKQTRNTVIELNRQSLESASKRKIDEALNIKQEICLKGIKSVSRLMVENELPEIKEEEQNIFDLIFNKYSYIIDPLMIEKLYELHELIVKLLSKGELDTTEKTKYNNYLTDLYQYYRVSMEEMNQICINYSSVSKELIDIQGKMLKNDKSEA